MADKFEEVLVADTLTVRVAEKREMQNSLMSGGWVVGEMQNSPMQNEKFSNVW